MGNFQLRLSSLFLFWSGMILCQAVSSERTSSPLTIAQGNIDFTIDPVEGSWNVTEKSVTCILLKAKITLSLNYTDVYNISRLTLLEVPPTALASGSCSYEDQHIILSWMQPNASQPHGLNNTLTLQFRANTTNINGTAQVKEIPEGKYALSTVSAIIHKDDSSLFPNVTNPTAPFVIFVNDLASFPTTLNHSYACQAVSSVEGSYDTQQRVQPKVLLRSLQVEAFRKASSPQNSEFSAQEHCAADEISSGSTIGTIVVTLLIIVLLALGAAALVTYYLKKRRVAATTGYENM